MHSGEEEEGEEGEEGRGGGAGVPLGPTIECRNPETQTKVPAAFVVVNILILIILIWSLFECLLSDVSLRLQGGWSRNPNKKRRGDLGGGGGEMGPVGVLGIKGRFRGGGGGGSRGVGRGLWGLR